HRPVVAEQPYEPDAADQRKWEGEHHDKRLGYVAEIQIQQQEDDGQRRWNDELHPLLGPLHILVLAAPGNRVARRHLDLACHHTAGLGHVTPHVASHYIDVHPGCGLRVLRPHHHRPRYLADRRHLTEGHEGLAASSHRPFTSAHTHTRRS